MNHRNLLCLIFSALALKLQLLAILAGTLTAVPMQGGMVMPMVAYHADTGKLHVTTPLELPQLTPLLVSHPDDQFDPLDPWFDALDPSRQGLAFSRRYGFVMDTMTDLLPPNTSIWIRKLSASPDLHFYRYASSQPKLWEPVFGTHPSSNELLWDGVMFHPAVTAPPGTSLPSATFEFYLAAADTGVELPGTASDPLLLQWTNVSDGRPTLDIAMKLVVAWPSVEGYALESTPSLDAADWTLVTNAPVILENHPAVVLPPDQAGRFYRLRRLP